jgi:signal transduction histidine kinase
LKRATKLNPEVKIMVIGADQHLILPLEPYRIEVDDYLLLPTGPTELWRRVSRCLEEVVDLETAASPVDSREAAINDLVSNRVRLVLHDIRGSMVSTAASLKLLIRGHYGETNPQVTKRLQELYDQVKNLTDFTAEFMNEAHWGNGRIESEEEILDLRHDVIEPVMEELAQEIKSQRITINNRLDSFPAEMIPVKGNQLTLKSVFRNLLNNAIKYGGPGCCILIKMEMHGSKCRLHVYNTGKPVPEGYRPLLFSKHLRLARKGKRDRGSMGLSLYLSRDILKNQGGDIWYEPRVDGSNFVVSLPLN